MRQLCPCLDQAVGNNARLEFTVSESDTALALGSGSVNVLATPRAIAWCEAATIAALAPAICSKCTTVGYTIEFAHLSPSLVGQDVNAAALVESVSGDRIVFTIELCNADAKAGEGKITRVRVDQKSWA